MTKADQITSHDVNERARLISHHLYAEQIDARPDLTDRAREFLDRGIAENGGTMGQQLWQSILKWPWHQVRERMLQDNPEGRLLRSNSPFSEIIGIGDEQGRRTIWRQAKAELCSLTTAGDGQ